ncbi:MAG: GNAT family N-acetyltransferase [Fibrobacter sp.]|nr:GNAT family N-acetyltransferase [Fibrobacter sp.]
MKRCSWLSIPYATVSDPVIKDESALQSLFTLLPNHQMTNRCPIELRMSSQMQQTTKFGINSGYVNHQIVLNSTEKEIFERFHKKAVQDHILKSLSSGISLKIGASLKDVEVFYRIYIMMRKELGLFPQPYIFFKNMWTELSPCNSVDLLLVEKNGKVIAGMFCLKNSWLYSFEYLARAGQKDPLHCNHFLYWHGIKRALEYGCKIVSFARTSVRNVGIDTFKRRWGTVVKPYYDYVYPNRNYIHRDNNLLYHMMKKYCKKLPLPVFRFFGEIVYKII